MASSACTRICVVCSVGEGGVVANADESVSVVAAEAVPESTCGIGGTEETFSCSQDVACVSHAVFTDSVSELAESNTSCALCVGDKVAIPEWSLVDISGSVFRAIAWAGVEGRARGEDLRREKFWSSKERCAGARSANGTCCACNCIWDRSGVESYCQVPLWVGANSESACRGGRVYVMSGAPVPFHAG